MTMEKSRLATYAVGALLGISAAVVYLATKNVELTAMLSTAAAGVLGYAKQHVADRSAPATASEETTKLPPNPRANTPVICALVLGSLLLAGQAMAQSPQFGGCIRDGAVCFGPSATVTVGQFNFSTSKFSGGIVPGIGYGATYAPTQWYATGLAGYLAFTVGRGAPNEAIPSLMLSFANYVRVGAGVSITETAGPVQTQWRLLFGLGSDFGGSPKYVASQGAR